MSKELNKAITERLGYIPCDEWELFQVSVYVNNAYIAKCNHEKCYPREAPVAYSTNGDAMLKLDEEMLIRGKRLVFIRMPSGKVCAEYIDIKMSISHGAVIADDEPLARALAAYKTLTGEEWENK